MVGNPEVNYLQNLLATRSESQEGLLSRKLTCTIFVLKSQRPKPKKDIDQSQIQNFEDFDTPWNLVRTRGSEVQILSPRPIISKRCRVVGKSPEARVSHVFPFKASFRRETFIY
jgi:hypothetical protein